MRKIFWSFLGFLLLLSGCNLVERAESNSVRALNKNGIEEIFYEDSLFKVHGYLGGQGPLLIFIHGFGGDAQLSWKQTLIDFSEDYTVLAADLLWFGKSESVAEANLSAQVEGLNRFIEHLQLRSKFTLIGHSYGGFVALAKFYENPEMVEKLVIINCPGVTYDSLKLYEIEKDAGVDNYWDLFVLKKPEQIDRLNEMAFLDPPLIPGFVKEKIYMKYFAAHHSQLTSLLVTLPGEQEKFLGTPVDFPKSIVIWGEYDKIFPLSEGEKLASYMSATFKVIPQTGHSAPFENYKMFKELLSAFLAE